MSTDASQSQDSKQSYVERVLQAVTTPLNLLALVVVASQLCLSTYSFRSEDATNVAYLLVGTNALVVMIVGVAVLREPGVRGLFRKRRPKPTGRARKEASQDSNAVIDRINKLGDSVVFSKELEKKELLDYWYRELRPILHQAAMYSTPTYYLDTKLRVVDWNIAFELIFESITGKIRGKHVNWLIARLTNHSEVFDHAKDFTEDFQRTNVFPFVDVEPLEYESQRYGCVRLTKIATQLHNVEGQFKGWSIALLIDGMEYRDTFDEELQKRIGSEKLWSVYSASYDRVLNRFPPYAALIHDVIDVIGKKKKLYVADLGAGTGNTTGALVAAGHRVVAVENNVGMLERFANKKFPEESVSLVKTSVEQLSCLPERLFDSVVMVNVLYAVEDPLKCLREVRRILKPGGLLGLSTTHREADLTPLLNSIEAELQAQDVLQQLSDDWNNVRKINRMLEQTIVRRHTREKYVEWLASAGFEVTKMEPSTYCDAVMVVHAKCLKDSPAVGIETSKRSVEAVA